MATLILKATHLYMSPKKHGFVYPWIMNVTLFSLLKLKPSQSTGEMCNLKVRKSSCWTDLWARPDQVQLSFFRPGLSNLGISGISGGGWVDLATQSAWGQVALTIALWFSVKPHKPSRFVVVGQEDLPRFLIINTCDPGELGLKNGISLLGKSIINFILVGCMEWFLGMHTCCWQVTPCLRIKTHKLILVRKSN